MSSTSSSNFEPLVVLHFTNTTPAATKEWVIKRLTASQEEHDGADLLVRYDTDSESHVSLLSFASSPFGEFCRLEQYPSDRCHASSFAGRRRRITNEKVL
jgi:hypothetical protein